LISRNARITFWVVHKDYGPLHVSSLESWCFPDIYIKKTFGRMTYYWLDLLVAPRSARPNWIYGRTPLTFPSPKAHFVVKSQAKKQKKSKKSHKGKKEERDISSRAAKENSPLQLYQPCIYLPCSINVTKLVHSRSTSNRWQQL
jgi:hypothetical protein